MIIKISFWNAVYDNVPTHLDSSHARSHYNNQYRISWVTLKLALRFPPHKYCQMGYSAFKYLSTQFIKSNFAIYATEKNKTKFEIITEIYAFTLITLQMEICFILFFFFFFWFKFCVFRYSSTRNIHLPTDSRRGLTASNTNFRGDDWCDKYFGLRCSKYPVDGDIFPGILATQAILLEVGDGVEYVIFGLRGGSSRLKCCISLKYGASVALVP